MTSRISSTEISRSARRMPAGLRAAGAAAMLSLLTACGAAEGIGGNFMPSKLLAGTFSKEKEMDPAVYAATPVCPTVEVRDGTEFMPVFEPGKGGNVDAIRFQASVQRVARDCEETLDGRIRVKVGVAGRVLSGAAGATGAVTVPVRVAATIGDKVVYSKLTTTSVTVQAPDYSALFSIVDEELVLSVADSKEVTIYVGLDGKGDVRQPKKGKKPVSKS